MGEYQRSSAICSVAPSPSHTPQHLNGLLVIPNIVLRSKPCALGPFACGTKCLPSVSETGTATVVGTGGSGPTCGCFRGSWRRVLCCSTQADNRKDLRCRNVRLNHLFPFSDPPFYYWDDLWHDRSRSRCVGPGTACSHQGPTGACLGGGGGPNLDLCATHH